MENQTYHVRMDCFAQHGVTRQRILGQADTHNHQNAGRALPGMRISNVKWRIYEQDDYAAE
jgi:hypothetical protein